MATCGLQHLLVEPVAWRIDGPWTQIRPVYDPLDWIHKVEDEIEQPMPWELIEQVEHLAIKNLKYPWMRWLGDGVNWV